MERERRGWSLSELAGRSGVSKAMISRIERSAASPTLALLSKLSAAFGVTLSALLDGIDGDQSPLRRAQEQPVWIDPGTHYQRRQITPPGASAVELIEMRLPAGARLAVPQSAFALTRQVLWALEGSFSVEEDDRTWRLYAGDCLVLGASRERTILNPTAAPCRYLVALARL